MYLQKQNGTGDASRKKNGPGTHFPCGGFRRSTAGVLTRAFGKLSPRSMRRHYTHSAALSRPPSEPLCCIVCGHITEPSYLCVGCGKARYCSRNCQSEHLIIHSRTCALLRAQRSAQLRRLHDAAEAVAQARQRLETSVALEQSCQLLADRGLTPAMLPRLVQHNPVSSSDDEADVHRGVD